MFAELNTPDPLETLHRGTTESTTAGGGCGGTAGNPPNAARCLATVRGEGEGGVEGGGEGRAVVAWSPARTLMMQAVLLPGMEEKKKLVIST